MDIINYLKKSSLYTVLVSESFISEEFRDLISKISKIIIAILIFVLLSLYFTKTSTKFTNIKITIEAYGLVNKTVGIILLNLGIYIYSQVAEFYLSSTYYFEKIAQNQYGEDDFYTFSAGRILYAGRKTDILHGFLISKIGKTILTRLGINQKDIKFFYNSHKIEPKEETPMKTSETLKAKDLMMYLYFKKPEFADFLNRKGVTEEKLFSMLDIVVSEVETREYNKQWWRPEILAKIKPLIK